MKSSSWGSGQLRIVLDLRLKKIEYVTLKFHRELKNEGGENKQVGANSGSSENHCILYRIIVTAAN